jgi:hypothetical protein
MRAALRRSVGIAQWKPRWHVLVVPTGDLADGASNVFSLGAPREMYECSVTRTTNPIHLVPNEPCPTNVAPMSIAPRYTAGSRKRPRPKQCWAEYLKARAHNEMVR